jgi:dTDP-4-amino-4,6-dideoxygalactose transaminase
VHLQKAHADLGCRLGDFPCSEEVAREVLSLPMFAELENEALNAVAEGIKSFDSREVPE